MHAVPFGFLASAGQFAPLPGQKSSRSHSPTEARQSVAEDLNASAGHVELEPVQVSATSQLPAAARHVVPEFPGLWAHAGEPEVPLHRSVVHTLPSSVHAVPAGFTVLAGQVALLPGQVSAMSHSLAAVRQTKLEDWKASFGHVLLLPVQVSATSHPPDAAARQVVPALPGLWTHSGLPTVPLQRSVVHTLPSSVHAVPDAFTVSFGHVVPVPVHSSALSHSLDAARHVTVFGWKTSLGHVVLEPVQFSAASHVVTAARQVNELGWKASLGHVLLLPVHVSGASHRPAALRHVVPAFPGACWQMLLAPLQRSVVQTLPSSVHAVPFVLNVHVAVQHEPAVPLFTPSSHDSGLSTTPSPQSE